MTEKQAEGGGVRRCHTSCFSSLPLISVCIGIIHLTCHPSFASLAARIYFNLTILFQPKPTKKSSKNSQENW